MLCWVDLPMGAMLIFPRTCGNPYIFGAISPIKPAIAWCRCDDVILKFSRILKSPHITRVRKRYLIYHTNRIIVCFHPVHEHVCSQVPNGVLVVLDLLYYPLSSSLFKRIFSCQSCNTSTFRGSFNEPLTASAEETNRSPEQIATHFMIEVQLSIFKNQEKVSLEPQEG